jgi:integrase
MTTRGTYGRGRMRDTGRAWVRERSSYAADGTRRWDRLRFPKSDFPTPRAAWAESDRLDELDPASAPARGRRVRFGAQLEVYRRSHVALLRKSSRQTIAASIKHLERELGDRHCDEIDGTALQDLIAALHARGLSRGSVYQVVSLARRVLGKAARDGIAARSIGPRTLAYPRESKPPDQPLGLAAGDVRAILEAAPWPDRAAYGVMAYAGLRSGEALGLDWRSVDFQRRRLRIRQQAVHGELAPVKSSNSATEIPMSAPLAALLEAWRGEWPPNDAGLLLVNPRTGTPLWARTLRSRFRSLCKRLAITPCGLHAFRHFAATAAFEAGLGAVAVRGLLRHGNVMTTIRYARASIDDVARGADAVGRAIAESRIPPTSGDHRNANTAIDAVS